MLKQHTLMLKQHTLMLKRHTLMLKLHYPDWKSMRDMRKFPIIVFQHKWTSFNEARDFSHFFHFFTDSGCVKMGRLMSTQRRRGQFI